MKHLINNNNNKFLYIIHIVLPDRFYGVTTRSVEKGSEFEAEFGPTWNSAMDGSLSQQTHEILTHSTVRHQRYGNLRIRRHAVHPRRSDFGRLITRYRVGHEAHVAPAISLNFWTVRQFRAVAATPRHFSAFAANLDRPIPSGA